jgi:uncharacterized protein (TIGR00297 family)
MFEMKKAKKLQEGEQGERTTSNVLYAGIIGLALACINFAHTLLHSLPFDYFELFAISFSVINSDTFASELGVVDKNVYMITTFKRTTPGINGGVSLTGEIAAFFWGTNNWSFLQYSGFWYIEYRPPCFCNRHGFSWLPG